MNPKPFLAAWAGAIGLMGCSETDQRDATSPPLSNVSAREMRLEALEAVDTARQPAVVNRDQFLASMEAKLKECGQRIADLDSKLTTLAYDYTAKAEGTKALDTLREKRTQLGQQLEKLRQCSQEAWQEARAAAESAAAEMDKAYENTRSRFKD